MKYNFKSYVTSYTEYPTWIDRLFIPFKQNTVAGTVFYVSLIYLFGLALSLPIGFLANYVRTGQVYMVMLGSAIVLFTLRYCSLNFYPALAKLRPCLLMEDDNYNKLLDKYMKKLKSFKTYLTYIVIIFIFGCSLIILAFFYREQLINFNLHSINPRLLIAENWYTGDGQALKFVILLFFVFIISMLLGTAVSLIKLNSMLLKALSEENVIPINPLIRFRLQGLSSLYTKVTLLWYFGVAVIAIVMFDSVDIISVTIVTVFSVLGLLVFYMPQYLYRKMLEKSYDLSSEWIIKAFYKKFNIDIVENENETLLSDKIGVELAINENLSDFLQESEPPKFWVYEPGPLVSILIDQIFTIICLFLEKYLN